MRSAHPYPVILTEGTFASMLPRYYINDLGGGATVNTLVGLAPSNYGTTLDGLVLDGLVTDISELGSLGPVTALLSG
jgi:hypothetical protein